MGKGFPQSAGPDRSTKVALSDRTIFVALLQAISAPMLCASLALVEPMSTAVRSAPLLVHYSAPMYLGTAMDTRIRDTSWPCTPTNVRYGDLHIVLGVLGTIEIVNVPPYSN